MSAEHQRIRNNRVKQQLGMHPNTANGRLTRLILFKVLAQSNQNICFKCSKVINEPNELSIEHIKPWENVSADLFWDINNITFSHRRCNRPHVYRGGGHSRKVPPVGMAWCATHKMFELIEMFPIKFSNWNGLARECRRRESNRTKIFK